MMMMMIMMMMMMVVMKTVNVDDKKNDGVGSVCHDDEEMNTMRDMEDD